MSGARPEQPNFPGRALAHPVGSAGGEIRARKPGRTCRRRSVTPWRRMVCRRGRNADAEVARARAAAVLALGEPRRDVSVSWAAIAWLLAQCAVSSVVIVGAQA